GGPTTTHALLPASPALDAGSAACPPPFTDQRGVTRPQGSACDSGAFEVGLPEAVSTPALLQPNAIAADHNGQLVVLDTRLQSIVRTDFASGQLGLVSGASVGSGTRLSRFLGGIAVESTGTLIVTDSGRNTIVRVNPVTGDRSIVSNGVTGTGAPFENPSAVAVEADGALIVIADNSVMRIHPRTGNRELVSGCSAYDGETCLGEPRGSGPPFVMLRDIDVEATGQLVVADGEQQAVIRVDPATGNRSIVSGNAVGRGPALDTPAAIAVEAGGDIVVAGFESILRVHPATGDRTIVSDGNRGGGPPLDAPVAMTVTPSGALAVADGNRLLRVDPGSGNRTVFASAQPIGAGPPIPGRALAVESQGTIVVAGAVAGRRAIIRVTPETGSRSLVSDTTRGSGPAFVGPAAIAIETDGSLVLVDVNRRDSGTVMRVDAATGDRTVISGCTQGSSRSCQGMVVGDGPPFQFPQSIAVEASGQLVIADRDRAAVLRVDPGTGNRMILSDNATGNGPALQSPRAIAIAPDGALMVVDAIVSCVPNVSVPDAVVRVHPVTGDRVLISGLPTGGGLLSVFDLLDAIAIEPGGSVIVASSFFRVLLRVHPLTGNRMVVSGEHMGNGPPFFPGSVAVHATHTLVVLDPQLGAVLHVDAASGERTLVSR
ncbi:MAG: NHL repeat-containing protein, partial [Candidatus Tectomicrobia bacterium]|nr:NHL repeat-containing protein [Candidatus Tectomicrobia bacterium]